MSKEDNDYEKNWEVEEDNIEEEDDDEEEDDEEEEDDDRETDNDEEEGEDEEEYENDDAEYEDDDDDDDDDDVEPPPDDDDDDDPEYSGVDPRGQPAEYYQPEYNPEDDDGADFKDEPEERPETRGERFGDRFLMSLCAILCCCVVLALLALVLLLVVFKGDSNSANKSQPSPTFPPIQPAQVPSPGAPVAPVAFSYPTRLPVAPPPTAFPTRSPIVTPAPTNQTINTNPTIAPSSYPTIKPTTTPSPTKSVEDSMVLIPVEDTYIVDGFFKFEAHGAEETFLVQNSADDVQEIPDSFALLKFDMSSVPFVRIRNRQLSATLELTHQVSVVDRGAATYTMARLPSTPLVVETLHLGIFPLPTNGINGTNFDVAPSDETVMINVTDLIFGDVYQPFDDPQALLMIVDYGPIKEAGDRFFTREATGKEPKLRLSMIRIPGVPDSTAAPVTPTQPPSFAPSFGITESPAPSTAVAANATA